MYNDDLVSRLSALTGETPEMKSWNKAAKKAVNYSGTITADDVAVESVKKRSKIQDALGSVKEALSSEAAGNFFKGLAATTAAAAIGGQSGVQALSGVMGAVKEKNKQRDLEKVQKAREQLSSETSNVNLQLLKEQLRTAELKNKGYETTGTFPGSPKLTAAGPRKTAAGPRKTAAAKTPKEVQDKIRMAGIMPESRLSGEVGNPNNTVEENQAVARAEARKGGAEMAADTVALAGLKGKGFKVYKESRGDLMKPVSSMDAQTVGGFNKELSNQIAPGEYDKIRFAVKNDPGAQLSWEESAAKNMPTAFGGSAGAVLGAGMGMAGGPIGMAAGGAFGGAIGAAISDPIAESMSKYLADQNPQITPDVASYGDEIVKGLQLSGVYDIYDVASIIDQLKSTQDFMKIPKQQQENLVNYIKAKFPSSYSRGDEGF